MRPVLLMVRELGGAGGSERQTAELAMSLDRALFEPHVACFREGPRAEQLRAAGIPVLRLPVDSFRSPSAIRGARVLAAYARDRGIRLAHAFDYPTCMYAAATARPCGIPVVLTSQRGYRDYLPRGWRHALRVTDQLVDGIVVNSIDLRRHMIEDERVPAHLLHVCPNAVDLAVFHPDGRRTPGRRVIGAVSVLRPEKGHHLLLEAFARIRRPSLRLRIAGGGTAEPDLRALAARLGIEEHCEFLPSTLEVAAHLREIDIFVLPSLTEGLSNALLEAMACGCCVIASDLPGNAEAAPDNEAGLLFRSGDAGDLARCLTLALDDSALRERLAAGALARVRSRFSREAAGRRLGEIYARHLA